MSIIQVTLANSSIGSNRKFEGDIVGVHPYGESAGGKETRKKYLFVPIDFGDLFKTWKDAKTVFRHGQYLDKTDISEPNAQDIKLAKNRFRITFSDVDSASKIKGVTINWKRVKDEKDDYQPLLDGEVILDYNDIYDKAESCKLNKSGIEVLRNSIVIKEGSKTVLDDLIINGRKKT